MPIPCHHISPSLHVGATLHADRDSIKVGFCFVVVKGSSIELHEGCIYLSVTQSGGKSHKMELGCGAFVVWQHPAQTVSHLDDG